MLVVMMLWIPQSQGATFYWDPNTFSNTWDTTTVTWRTAPSGGGTATAWAPSPRGGMHARLLTKRHCDTTLVYQRRQGGWP